MEVEIVGYNQSFAAIVDAIAGVACSTHYFPSSSAIPWMSPHQPRVGQESVGHYREVNYLFGGQDLREGIRSPGFSMLELMAQSQRMTR